MNAIEPYDYIRFTVGDIHGRSRGRVVPVRHAQNCIESGVSLFGGFLRFTLKNSLVPTSEDDPDCERTPLAIIKPIMETIYPVPWCGGDKFKVAEVICESYWLKDQTPQQACPRYVARQQLRRLEDHGFELLSGFEMEFTLHKKKTTFPSEPNYMSQREQAKRSEFFFEAEHLLHLAGVDVESFHSEHDPGSFEAVLKPLKGIDSVDAGFKFKNDIQEIADVQCYDVSFMSRQINANLGMHFNHSLWSVSEKTNVFSSGKDLSDIGRHWLAGLIKHAKALTALFSPTMNCYERLRQPHKPSALFWGHYHRSACVRVKQNDAKKGIYFENRMPSGMSNPYLVLAATVAAGLDGVIRKLDCPPEGKSVTMESASSTLSEALDDLLIDKEMVESLGKEFVDGLIATLRSDVDDSYDLCSNGKEDSQCVIE